MVSGGGGLGPPAWRGESVVGAQRVVGTGGGCWWANRKPDGEMENGEGQSAEKVGIILC